MSALVDDLPLLCLNASLTLVNTDGLRSSTSGSSVSGGGLAVSAGGGGLDPLSVDFLTSLRGETDLLAFLWEF